MGVSDFFESRPQRLCHMCGKCCRVVTTATPYETLKTLASQGDACSMDFLELFEPYESIEAAENVDKVTVDDIINVLKNEDNFDIKNLIFYKCRYLSENNLCKIYQNRKERCHLYPSSPWVAVPPGCGFEGWLFKKREEIKKEIRKQKENILYAETLLSEAETPEQIEKIKATIENIKNTINLYAKYGANYW